MQARAWVARGTELFLAEVAKLTTDDWEQPAALPPWRPREIVAHVHLNAEALQRLVSWARTGVENPMYPDPQRRDDDIKHLASAPIAKLRELVVSSARDLDTAMDKLSPQAWEHPVVTATGRNVPAREIPWMRAREVAIHAIDLGTGLGFDDLPDAFNEALVRDIVELRLLRGEGAVLAAWLSGRADDPALGRWI